MVGGSCKNDIGEAVWPKGFSYKGIRADFKQKVGETPGRKGFWSHFPELQYLKQRGSPFPNPFIRYPFHHNSF